MENLYIGLIGDIVKSRKLQNRGKVQLELEKTLKNINQKYSQYIVSQFLITLGDEFQGLLKPTAPIYKIICEIIEEMYPVQIRIGLGYDKITTNFKNEALGMDGPAFYLARDAINIAHKKEGHTIVFKSNILNEHEENSINIMFESISVIKKLWDDSFWKILKYLRNGKKQKEIAALTGVSQPYVSKLIKNAYWKEVKELEDKMPQLLRYFLIKR